MHLGIDLRFYSSSPYGLSVYIKNVMKELLPQLVSSKADIHQISLFLPYDYKECEKTVKNDLGVTDVMTSKIKFQWSKAKFYTVAEQISFVVSLYRQNIDLMYFFTPNIPILYFKPFVYQIMDATLLEHRGVFNPRRIAFKLCLYIGLKRAQNILFLSSDARKNIREYFPHVVTPAYISTKTDVLHAGISELFTSPYHSNPDKAQLLGLSYSNEFAKKNQEILTRFGITKPFFHFISVLRSYKNIKNLVRAFELINGEGLYQLVIAGSEDPKFPDIVPFVKNSSEYKKGNIILTGRVSDDEVLALVEYSNGLVAPSKAEGFGLWLLEAAARGTGIIASNIPVFKEIIDVDSALMFDPYDVQDMARVWMAYIQQEEAIHNSRVCAAYHKSKTFTWNKTAEVIARTLLHTIDTLSYEQKK